MKNRVFCLISSLFLASAPVAEEIYTWTDESGEVVFSQTPPSTGIGTTVVDVKSEAVFEKNTSPDATMTKRVEQQEVRLDDNRVAINCEYARANIAMLRLGSTSGVFLDKQGNEVSYSKSEIMEKIKRNQALVNKWCSLPQHGSAQ